MIAMQTLANTGYAGALYNVGVLLGELGQFEEAVRVCDLVVDRCFGEDPYPDAAVRLRVARALVNKGVALSELGRFEEAVGVCDQVVNRVDDDLEPALRELAAMARRMKGEVEGEH